MLIQLYIPIDFTRQIKSFVKNDLLLHTKVIIQVNRNYVNLAVKFRYPNAMELRPLKCCICPKLTPPPRAQKFRTWKCLFCPSRNKYSDPHIKVHSPEVHSGKSAISVNKRTDLRRGVLVCVLLDLSHGVERSTER